MTMNTKELERIGEELDHIGRHVVNIEREMARMRDREQAKSYVAVVYDEQDVTQHHKAYTYEDLWGSLKPGDPVLVHAAGRITNATVIRTRVPRPLGIRSILPVLKVLSPA